MTLLKAPIYSPRWGHDDEYEFELTQDALIISNGPRKLCCNWVEGKDPEWTGESLENHFKNDSIQVPVMLPNLLEHLWRSWRNGDLTDNQAQQELEQLTRWIDAMTSLKPKTEFWNSYF